MLLRCLAVSVFTVTIAGCLPTATPTLYSGGVSEAQLAPNVWRVSFRGNGFTSSDRAEESVILRAADLTIQTGYKFFTLSSTENKVAKTHIASDGDLVTIHKPSSVSMVQMYKESPKSSSVIYDAAFICESLGKKYNVQCGVTKKL